MLRKRRHNVHVWTHPQTPLQRLDRGQADRITCSQCNHTATLISILGFSQPVLQETKSFLISSGILTTGPLSLISILADRHSTTPRVTLPLKQRLTSLKTQKICCLDFFILSILISPCLFLTSIFFFLFLKLKLWNNLLSSFLWSELT